MVFGLPWLRSNQSDDRLGYPVSHFQNGPSIGVTIVGLGQACSTAALRHEDIISDLSPVFGSIPELSTASGPFAPDQGGREYPKDAFCSVGAVLVKLYAPWIYTLGPSRICPPALIAWDRRPLWFSASDTFEPMAGGVISPATVLPCHRMTMLITIFYRGSSPDHSQHPLCQVEAIPCKSEGIEPFTTVNTPPCQVGVTPRKSEGIEPFTTVTTPPCQVGVTPRNQKV